MRRFLAACGWVVTWLFLPCVFMADADACTGGSNDAAKVALLLGLVSLGAGLPLASLESRARAFAWPHALTVAGWVWQGPKYLMRSTLHQQGLCDARGEAAFGVAARGWEQLFAVLLSVGVVAVVAMALRETGPRLDADPPHRYSAAPR